MTGATTNVGKEHVFFLLNRNNRAPRSVDQLIENAHRLVIYKYTFPQTGQPNAAWCVTREALSQAVILVCNPEVIYAILIVPPISQGLFFPSPPPYAILIVSPISQGLVFPSPPPIITEPLAALLTINRAACAHISMLQLYCRSDWC